MRIKHLGDQFSVWGACCPGQISAAGFLLGIKEFLLAVRTDPELATLAFKCATAVLHRRIDIMLPILGDQLDDNGKGNIVWWCDGAGGYMTADEFKKNFDEHYGASIRYVTDKGWYPYTALGGPKGTLEACGSCMQENGGGGVMFAETSGAIEQGFETLNNYPNVVLMTYPATRTVLNGSPDDIKNELMRIVNSAKATTKGQRVSIHNNYDVQTPVEKIDLTLKLEKELFKLPLK